VEWWGVFWETIPKVFRALWVFMRGWAGVGIIVGSGAMMIGFALAAVKLRDTFGWLAAIFGMMSATVAAWWAFGIIPSAWIYFADGQRDLMEGTVIAKTLGTGQYVVATNFYEVFRDMVVMGETTIAMVVFAIAALRIQAKFPRALAEGEEPRPQSGGYK
jgi:nucleoside permease NupC